MNTPLHLTDRDREILMVLVQKVRLLGQRQIAEHWWHGDLANTRRRMRRLAEKRLAECHSVLARTIPPLNEPIIHWNPGDPTPEFGAVAYRCRERWRRRPARPVTVWVATEKSAGMLGGGSHSMKHRTQVTHDLGTAAVWLQFRAKCPQLAAAWRGEDRMAPTRRGEKLPDAFILNVHGDVEWVIEFGGGYDASRVEAFHHDCSNRNLPYQLW